MSALHRRTYLRPGKNLELCLGPWSLLQALLFQELSLAILVLAPQKDGQPVGAWWTWLVGRLARWIQFLSSLDLNNNNNNEKIFSLKKMVAHQTQCHFPWDKPRERTVSPREVPRSSHWVAPWRMHLTIPCSCSYFPFFGIEFSDLSAEEYYSNEKHFQEISPRQI